MGVLIPQTTRPKPMDLNPDLKPLQPGDSGLPALPIADWLPFSLVLTRWLFVVWEWGFPRHLQSSLNQQAATSPNGWRICV